MINIIVTTSIIDKFGLQHGEERKNRYLTCIYSLLHLIKTTKNSDHFKVFIVENNGKRETYFDVLKSDICEVVYTDNNQSNLEKGKKELLDIKHVIETYNIPDDDIVIKLTGRYRVLSNQFFNIVDEHQNNFDAFLKFFNVCTFQYLYDDCVLGLFAIKCKYLKNFNYDYIKSPELEFATHVRKHCTRIAEMQNLGLECCFGESMRYLIV
jgi:hypothetical protein